MGTVGIYIQYINKIVVLASEPVGGRSRATELPCFVCSFRYFTSVSNLKAIGLLLMEILHFEDFVGIQDLCCLAANAVVLVLGEYQISIATYLGGGGGGIYPHIKF